MPENGGNYIYLVSNPVVHTHCTQLYTGLHKVYSGCIQVATSIEYERHGFKKQVWVPVKHEYQRVSMKVWILVI